MENVLVIGAAGFIGRRVVSSLSLRCERVFAIIKEDDEMEGFPSNVIVLKCNMESMCSKLTKYITIPVECAVFLAWDGLDNESLLSYSKQLVNVSFFLDFINVCAQLGVEKIVGAGSISQLELRNVYAYPCENDKHKYYKIVAQCCENMGFMLAKELGMKFVWLMITNIYGENEKNPRFISSLLKKLVKGEDVITSVGNQFYDFIYLDDAAEIFVRVMEKNLNDSRYVLGSGTPRRLSAYLDDVSAVIESKGKIIKKLEYRGYPYSKEDFDSSKLLNEICYVPQTSFVEGIKKILNSIKV